MPCGFVHGLRSPRLGGIGVGVDRGDDFRPVVRHARRHPEHVARRCGVEDCRFDLRGWRYDSPYLRAGPCGGDRSLQCTHDWLGGVEVASFGEHARMHVASGIPGSRLHCSGDDDARDQSTSDVDTDGSAPAHSRKAAIGREDDRRAGIGQLRLDLRGRNNLDRQRGGGGSVLRRVTARFGGGGGKRGEQQHRAERGGEGMGAHGVSCRTTAQL